MPASLTLTTTRFATWVGRWAKVTAPTRGIIVAGTLFSVLITLSSIWVGILGTESPLWGIDWFRDSRGNPIVVTAAAIGLTAGSLGLVVCWLLLGRRVFRADKKLPTPTVALAAAWWAVPLILALPLYDRDIFSYIAQGRLLANGFDPYRWSIDSIPSWQDVGADPLWRSTLTPYGPVMLAIQHAVAVVTGPLGYHATILTYRILATLGLVASTLLVCRIARRSGRSTAKILWVCLANPLMLYTFVLGAHNDAIMIALLLGALAAAIERHPALAVVLLALAIGTKSVAIIALPILGIIHLGDDAPFRKKLAYWTGSGLAALGILTVIGAVQGFSLKWLLLASTPTLTASWFAPSSIIAAAIAGVSNLFGLTFDGTFFVGKVIAVIGAIGAGSYFLLTKRAMHPLHRLVLAFSAVIFFSPVIYSWYIAWPLFVATAAGLTLTKRGRLIVAITTIFFVGKGLIAPFNYTADALFVVVQGVLATAALGAGLILLWLEMSSHAEDTKRLPIALRNFVFGDTAWPTWWRRRSLK